MTSKKLKSREKDIKKSYGSTAGKIPRTYNPIVMHSLKVVETKLAEALRRKLDIGQANPYFLLALPIVRNERILLSIFWSLSSGSEFTDQQMYHFN
ncbi:6121_t:CDS:2 [Funneliformis caledonium]|uniref:6121_t:CDS:1 n=1 Tax=Funneliformis caledonium TaxID=1117310 RepID=A0A9N9AGA3_9GLOM|nr:6121_t:CDS:2 [Funneliformis caledonium]